MSSGYFRVSVLLLFAFFAASGAEIAVEDFDGALGATRAPVTATVKLSARERRAAMEGRLQLRELSASASTVPVQLSPIRDAGANAPICWLMPIGSKGRRTFKLEQLPRSAPAGVMAKQDPASGQFDITDAGKPVLRYNYASIEPGDIISQVATNSRIYARARSDYIHPLFGLDGETLTKDWSVDHPHHRGIYWAWPEVDWRGNRGDLHALQHVFTRPIGKCAVTSGPVFAQLEAENVWKWKDADPIVHERAIIRAYRATGDDRLLDLEFQFAALNDPVLLARRGTLHYGGLNLRLASVKDQEIISHTDATNVTPRAAWAELSGKFGEAPQPSGIVVLQHSANPDYPGEWVQFPNLNWFQPTFPDSGTRYELKQGQPLVLRFRLWLHRGAKAGEENCVARWRAYHAATAPSFFPVLLNLKRPSSS
jgi:hypothetical protein